MSCRLNSCCAMPVVGNPWYHAVSYPCHGVSHCSVMSADAISWCIDVHHVVLGRLMSCCLVSCLMSHRIMSCHIISFQGLSCHVVLCHVSCHVMCCVISYRVICHLMSCHTMIFFSSLCNASHQAVLYKTKPVQYRHTEHRHQGHLSRRQGC